MSNERIIDAAKRVFYWYYIFGEDNMAARSHLVELGHALQDGGHIFLRKENNIGKPGEDVVK